MQDDTTGNVPVVLGGDTWPETCHWLDLDVAVTRIVSLLLAAQHARSAHAAERGTVQRRTPGPTPGARAT